VQRAVVRFFHELPQLGTQWTQTSLAGWTVLRPQTDLRLAGDARVPTELIPASDLRFNGLRNVYQRDGFGSDFVAVAPAESAVAEVPWRNPRYVSMTGALVFDGHTLAEVLATKQVQLLARDPYRNSSITVGGHVVPLGANFTAAHGVWLARSGFASQSIRSLLGREGGITTPRVHYHTIVGVYKPTGPLVTSSDGVVPYQSAHLDGADSELAVPSWHRVQETPAAILELRRILALHAAAVRVATP
jgi:hypothetical protein